MPLNWGFYIYSKELKGLAINMNVDGYKEVYFNEYCKTCKNKDLDEKKDPCFECLSEPMNLYSHKPVRWEEADK